MGFTGSGPVANHYLGHLYRLRVTVRVRVRLPVRTGLLYCISGPSCGVVGDYPPLQTMLLQELSGL